MTEFVPGQIAIGVNKPGYSRDMRIGGVKMVNGVLSYADVESLDGLPVLIEETNPHSRLVPVIGRGPVTYDVPSVHKGDALPDAFPTTFADLAVAYLSALVEEARARSA